MSKKISKEIIQVAGIVIVLLLFVGTFSFVVDLIAPSPKNSFSKGEFRDNNFRHYFEFKETFTLVQVVLATLNSFLLVYLLFNYVSLYNQIKSKFALGLIVAATSFLAFTFTANPVIHSFFGFRGSGLGPFAMLPLIFSLIVTLVLIYLSKE